MRMISQQFACGATLICLCALSGCGHPYYAPAVAPPPPPVYQPAGPLLELAARNGFSAGQRDGAQDRYNGFRAEPRRTIAYRDAPGYDGRLGPAEPYVNEFRLSYLRGYQDGYSR